MASRSVLLLIGVAPRDHFAWFGAALPAKSDIGRVTIYVLDRNELHQVEDLRRLSEEGLFPWRATKELVSFFNEACD